MPPSFERTLPSRYELLSPLADEVSEFLETHLDDEELAYRALLLTSEAMTNGMEHGNELDPNRMVILQILVGERSVRVTVEDEGPGFDPAQAPDAVSDDDPLSARHRGLFLMRTYADEMRFENGGRRIVLEIGRT